jgi:hypothetical protein
MKEFAVTLKKDKRTNKRALSLIRYTDDFVIIHENLNVLLKCKDIIGRWLTEFGSCKNTNNSPLGFKTIYKTVCSKDIYSNIQIDSRP